MICMKPILADTHTHTIPLNKLIPFTQDRCLCFPQCEPLEKTFKGSGRSDVGHWIPSARFGSVTTLEDKLGNTCWTGAILQLQHLFKGPSFRPTWFSLWFLHFYFVGLFSQCGANIAAAPLQCGTLYLFPAGFPESLESHFIQMCF